MQSKGKGTVTIIGAGSFGTSLAIHLARQNFHVKLWARDPLLAEHINSQHRNPRYLNHLQLSKDISAYSNLQDPNAYSESEMVVFAIPTQAFRQTLSKLKECLAKPTLFVSTAKGIELKTERFPSQIIEEEMGSELSSRLAVLSGPSFAVEIAEGQPTGVAMGSKNIAVAKQAQALFHSPLFRVYANQDPIGLELAGALKNVIALAAGACFGLGFQNNSLATLITRGLAEMTRIGVRMGANPHTFIGLGGVGDLLLTCTSQKSRNFTVGMRLGKGEDIDKILNSLRAVAEGVTTANSAYHLCRSLGVRAPIINSVYEFFYEKKPLKDVVQQLTNGDAQDELESV